MTEPSPAAIGGTEVHDVRSDAVGDTFRIFVGHCGTSPESALVLTDANWLFGLTVDTVRMMQWPAMLPSTLVIGIGYRGATSLADTRERRGRDLTPTARRMIPDSGGGVAFHAFIRDQLLPWVAQRWPGSTGTTTYFGHSLGGMFGAHMLLEEPSTFDRYVLSSPSLWWDDRVLLRREAERAERERDLSAGVYVGIGAEETDAGRRREAQLLADDHPAKPPAVELDMVDDVRRFVTQLGSRRYPSLRLESAVFPDEFHATVPGTVLGRGLRFHAGFV